MKYLQKKTYKKVHLTQGNDPTTSIPAYKTKTKDQNSETQSDTGIVETKNPIFFIHKISFLNEKKPEPTET